MSVKDTINLYKELSGQKDINSMIASAGNSVGISNDIMHPIGMIESGLRPHAKAGTTSATGLYQFTKGTWDEQMAKYGAQFGIPAGTTAKDPAANAILAAVYLKQNAQSFKNAFGRDADSTDVYLGHFLGASGRNKFLKQMEADPSAAAFGMVSPRVAKANHNIFYNKDGSPKSGQDVYNHFTNLMTRYAPQKPTPVEDIVEKKLLKDNPKVQPQQDESFTPPLLPTKQMPDEPQVQTPAPDAPLNQDPVVMTPSVPDAPFIGSDTFNPNSNNDYLTNDGRPTMQEQLAQQDEDSESTFAGTWDSIKANVALSPLGVTVRKQFKQATGGIFREEDDFDPQTNMVLAAFNNKPLPEQFKNNPYGVVNDGALFTPDVIEKIKSTGLKPEYMDLLKTSINYKDLEQNLEIALENQKYDEERHNAGIGAGMIGGLAGAPLDPYTYATGGAANLVKGGKAIFISGAEAAIGNVFSELNQSHLTGAKAELAQAAIGGFVFGSGFRFLGDKFNDITPHVATRLKARQESIQVGSDDITKVAKDNLPDFGKAKYLPFNNEEGSIVLRDGTVMSGSNIFNPKTHDAARKLGWRTPMVRPLKELNQTLLGSKSKELRDLASKFTRLSSGYADGGTGIKGATVEDIHSMLTMRDNKWLSDFDGAQKKALNSTDWQLDGSYNKQEQLGRRITTALESGNMDKLSPEELEMANIWSKQMEAKHLAATKTKMFGEKKARSILKTERDPKQYVPQVYEDGRLKAASIRFDGNNGLKKQLVENWNIQVNENHNGVKNTFKELFDEDNEKKGKVIPEDSYESELKSYIDDYIEKKAYGIANQGEFSRSSLLDDAQDASGLVGIANNNFAEERNLFDSGFEHLSSIDGNPFSVNDLRMFDMIGLGDMYNRRMNGDIAIMGATGKSTQKIKDMLSDMEGKVPEHELRAMKDFIKLATGRSRKATPDGAWDMVGRAMMDGTFATVGTMMWTNQIGEVAGLATQQMMKLMRGGVPTLKAMFNPASKFSKRDLEDFSAGFFGHEINKVMTTSFKGFKEQLMEQGYGKGSSNTVAGLRFGAQWAAQKSPFTQLLNKSTEMMVDFARNGALGDIAKEAMLDKPSVFNDAILKAADISPEQYADIKQLFRDNVKIDPKDGSFKFKNSKRMMNDPRAMDLWRFTDYLATDAVFRPNKIGNNYTAQPNVFTQMALQFKSFYLKGLNGKVMKMLNESRNGRAADHIIQTVLSTGIGMAMYCAQTWYKSIGVPEDERQDYLDKALDPYMIGYQGLGRSSVLGSALSLANLPLGLAGLDAGKLGRTTITPESVEPDSNIRSGAMSPFQMTSKAAANLGQQMPVFGKVMAGASTLYNLAGSLGADEGYEEMSYNKQLFNSLRSLGFNEPMFQAYLNDWADNVGVLDKSMN